MNVELSEPLSITMKAISAQQKRFTAAFPFHKIKGENKKAGHAGNQRFSREQRDAQTDRFDRTLLVLDRI